MNINNSKVWADAQKGAIALFGIHHCPALLDSLSGTDNEDKDQDNPCYDGQTKTRHNAPI
jgi:hypothetical protein